MSTIKPSSLLISQVIEMTFSIAVSLGQTTITTDHLLFAVLQHSVLCRYFVSKGVDINAMLSEILAKIEENTTCLQNHIHSDNESEMIGQLTPELVTMFESIPKFAASEKRDVDIVDILLGLFNLREYFCSYFMLKYGITEDMILQLRKGLSMSGQPQGDLSKNGSDALSEYCINLNEKAKTAAPDPLIGRNKEILTIAHTLSKRKKCNVLMIGEPGVGKSIIIEGLAQRINEDNVPTPLKGKEIFSLDVGSLVSGSKFRGDFEEKVKEILNALIAKPNAILYVDEAHQVDVGDGKGQMGMGLGLGLSSMLKPELSRGSIKVIMSTTWEGYRTTFEKDTALLRRFRKVTVNEPSESETLEILKGCRQSVESFHGVKIDDAALKAAIDLTIKYQPELHLPDKAIDILDSACARKKVTDSDDKIISRESIITEITELTGITIKNETNDVDAAQNILSLASRLKKKIFHQDKAINSVTQSMIISQAGLKNPNKPIGSFLFVGPSGTGKTYLGQQLAIDLHMNFIRYNMSEFMEKHSVSRFIGAPPGYVGFGNGGTGEGQLVNDINKHPNSVILFDEVEKAHPDIFNIFLQLLDEGQVSNTTGKTANAKNCVIIMTSNLGTRESVKDTTGFSSNKTGKSASSKAIDNFFLTELRGRMTGIVEFEELDDLSYRRIVAEHLTTIGNMISTRLVASEALVSHILKLNNSKEYGARQLAKTINDIINYPLSLKLLDGSIKTTNIIKLDWINDELIVEPQLTKIPVVVQQ